MSEKVFFHTAHKALWNWVSNNPRKELVYWPGWEKNGGNVNLGRSYSFECEYAENNCSDCPLVWPGANCTNETVDNIFGQWVMCFYSSDASKFAAQIRDLPVREGVVCK